MLQNRVLLVLAFAGVLAALTLAFLTHAPNRLTSGTPLPLTTVAEGWRLAALFPGLLLLIGPFLPPHRATQTLLAAAAVVFLVALIWLAGAYAATLDNGSRVARTSLGGAFWMLFVCTALALTDVLYRLGLAPLSRFLVGTTVVVFVALLATSGALDQLAIVREYANRRDALADAVVRHVVMVLLAVLSAIVLGVPLGLLAHRRRTWRSGLFSILNVVQTIPSIALFGLLIAPLSGLATLFPRLATLGIGGIGIAPAVVALILYSLLPIVRNTAEGLASVSTSTIDAARGIGMTPRQIFRRVEIPLALPVFLSGLRIATVQTIGLAAVAALIGAGGLGAIMFQGLFANALDLVLLGAIPIVGLALTADAFLKLLAGHIGNRYA